MFTALTQRIQGLFITVYSPRPDSRPFLARGQTQEVPHLCRVSVSVPSAEEAAALFGVPLARRKIQPVHIRLENHSPNPLRLQLVGIDPEYFTPLEAAGLNHFSLLKRLSALGFLGWFLLPMLLFILPLKLLTAWLANRKMDRLFQDQAFRLSPIKPGETVQGFVFTRFDAGTKVIPIRLYGLASRPDALKNDFFLAENLVPAGELSFAVPIPGIRADYLRRDFDRIASTQAIEECPDGQTLAARLANLPGTTTNSRGTGTGDPVNLVVVGQFSELLESFTARWDETETITLGTSWKTVRSFLLGTEYRYSPVSPLYLFGRSHDLALQRVRHSINERLHLRLWLSRFRHQGRPVWVGQVSRDIGVRFTPKTWNLTTHRIDPNVDESRDYVLEDLLEAKRLEGLGYVPGVGERPHENPGRNLTGDPYFTDGFRAIAVIGKNR